MKLLTWNLGYGGLGAEADFIADGGHSVLPPSKSAVRKNVNQIVSTLEAAVADILILQEVAHASLFNYGVNLHKEIRTSLYNYCGSFERDVELRFFPRRLQIQHGLEILSKTHNGTNTVYDLPLETRRAYSPYIKRYKLQTLSGFANKSEPEWFIGNVHLSAFDYRAKLRRLQVEHVMSIAQNEYKKGKYVVVGGDWNLRLTQTNFGHSSEERHISWLYDFFRELLPKGWHMGIDPTRPTVRTCQQPYIFGENYTAVIDGFICSPNVSVDSVHTVDLQFSCSDHHPVSIEVNPR